MDDEWVMDSGWTDGRCSHRFVCSFLWGQSRELGEALGGGHVLRHHLQVLSPHPDPCSCPCSWGGRLRPS